MRSQLKHAHSASHTPSKDNRKMCPTASKSTPCCLLCWGGWEEKKGEKAIFPRKSRENAPSLLPYYHSPQMNQRVIKRRALICHGGVSSACNEGRSSGQLCRSVGAGVITYVAGNLDSGSFQLSHETCSITDCWRRKQNKENKTKSS